MVLIDGVTARPASWEVNGGTLGGLGVIQGVVNVRSGGNLSPGDLVTALGTLAISNNLTFFAGSTVTMDADKSGSTFTSDLITNIATLTLGGTLQLNLTGDPLVNGDSFKLFSFNSASGAFTAINPAQPDVGLQWDTSHLTSDGTLRVTAVNTTPTNITAAVSGNMLTLSWPADHTGWRLQAQTNALSIGINTNWADVAGSTLVNSVIVTMDPANGTVLYRMIYP
jgi:hypothetical protein